MANYDRSKDFCLIIFFIKNKAVFMSHSVLYGITAHVQVLLRGADGEEEVLPATKMSLSLVSAPAHSLMGHRVFLQEVGGGEGAPLSHCKQTSTDGDVKR